MKTDYYQNIILNKNDAVNCLLQGNDIDGVFLNDAGEVDLFNLCISRLTELNDRILKEPEVDTDLIDYHSKLSQVWMMPNKYHEIDLKSWLLNKAETNEEKDRVIEELNLYHERNLEDLLRYMIYLVDYFRQNKILWGIGRGSSVSSYVLYLIGINRINPMKYNLRIEEFLK